MTYEHIFKYIELLGSKGLMGIEEDSEAKKRFGMGKWWFFILKMLWEQTWRTLKVGAVVGVGTLLQKSLKSPELKTA